MKARDFEVREISRAKPAGRTCLGSPSDRAGELVPSALQQVDLSAFPIAIFVGRDGTIRAAHAGFPGPESKAEHARTVAAYRAGVAAILAD